MVPLLSPQYLFCALQSCRRERRIHTVYFLRAYLLRIGVEVAQIPWLSENLIISILAECGEDTKCSLQVPPNLIPRDLYSWNALICGFMRHGEPEKALNIYMIMKKEHDSIHLSGHSFVLLLKACIKVRNIEIGRDIHDQITRNSLLGKDVFLGSTVVDMYSENGEILKAQEVFEKLSIRDIVTWTAIILACVNHGYGKEGLHYFEEMQEEGISPDASTFACTLKACGIVKDTEKGQELYDHIIRIGLEKNLVVASALVNMFVKCGWIAKAREVFDSTMDRNVVSWNALISGYVDYGHDEEALKCFEQLQNEGISPDTVTYVCCLKACSSLQSIHMGAETYSEITSKGFERDVTIGNTLIDMYIKYGLLIDAWHVFNSLQIRTLVSWNVLIGGYVNDGNEKEIFDCLKQMTNECILPDSITFTYCLKVCGMSRAIHKVNDVHNRIILKGFERNVSVANSLIDAYSKCAHLAEAKETFNKILAREVISWNTLIGGYVQHGYSDEVVEYLEKMEFETAPDSVTFSSVLKACSNIGEIRFGQKIHTEICKKGFETDHFIGSTLIDMYAKCFLFPDLLAVFNQLHHNTTFSWNALLGGYVEHKLYEQAYDLLQQMEHDGISPDAMTLVHCLKVCSNIATVKKGQQIHKIMVCKGLDDIDALLHSSLVDMYVKCGMLFDAEEVFNRLPVRSAFSWAALITGYIELGHQEDVCNCLERMHLDNIHPDLILFACILRACSCIEDRDKGLAVHTQILQEGFEGDIVIGSALIDMYVKFGLLAEAEVMLYKLQVRTVFTWTTLITGYVCHGFDDSALDCFERMQEEFISPDDITLACTLNACGNLGSKNKGRKVFSQIAYKGLERDTYIGNSLVDMYVKCGLLDEAQKIFNGLLVKSEIAWTTLITGYAQAGESENVFMTFARMLEANAKPTGVTFISILNACSHGGVVEEGEWYLYAMIKYFECIPTLEHYSCIVDILGRAGHLEKAIAVIECMPFHPVNVVWVTLLGACRKWGSVELGQEAFIHTQQLDENDVAAHICMLNIYMKGNIEMIRYWEFF